MADNVKWKTAENVNGVNCFGINQVHIHYFKFHRYLLHTAIAQLSKCADLKFFTDRDGQN